MGWCHIGTGIGVIYSSLVLGRHQDAPNCVPGIIAVTVVLAVIIASAPGRENRLQVVDKGKERHSLALA